MRLEGYFPAKNNVLIEEVKVASSGSILLSKETSAGYYKIIAVGPMCEKTKIGDYIVSTLQLGVEMDFDEGKRLQMPEHGIDGYYSPTKKELENPVPMFTAPEEDTEELNVIDSESDGGDNLLGTEPGLREN